MKLTAKQAEVLQCLCCGLGDKQICDSLRINHPALRKRFAALFKKFSVHARTGLAMAYDQQYRAGLIAITNDPLAASRKKRPVKAKL